MAEISSKMQERNGKCYGYVMRRDEGYVRKCVMEMEVLGDRRRGEG